MFEILPTNSDCLLMLAGLNTDNLILLSVQYLKCSRCNGLKPILQILKMMSEKNSIVKNMSNIPKPLQEEAEKISP